jgi:sulfur transfer protein SufE
VRSNIAFLKEWGIDGALSMGRSNGLYQIHLRMKQDALKFLISR